METELYKVMEEFEGYCQPHTKMLDYDEAVKLERHLTELFTESHFYIVQHSEYEIERAYKDESRIYNNNAVDGWEDIYPN